MARKYFGTDGIRGPANGAITAELALKVGMAAGLVFQRGDYRHRVIIGKDTRLSGYMIENALVAGFTAVGMDVLQTGPLPTPAVAMLTRSMRCDLGVMISASHNPIEDNGIKFFGPDGFKLSDALEDEIAARLHDPQLPRPTHADVGVARVSRGIVDRYMMMLVEAGTSLAGWTIVVDAAFGAAYQVAPAILKHLGAQVIAINAEGDGRRINVGCGATDLRMLQEHV